MNEMIPREREGGQIMLRNLKHVISGVRNPDQLSTVGDQDIQNNSSYKLKSGFTLIRMPVFKAGYFLLL